MATICFRPEEFIINQTTLNLFIIKPLEHKNEEKIYVCHCEDVTLDEVLTTIGDRKFISVDEIKHTTRLGMGACRGKRCIKRLKSTLAPKGIQVVGDASPRGPLSNQLALGELYPKEVPEIYVTGINGGKARVEKVSALIAGGGIGGSALFRYMSEAGLQPTMLNYGRGSSWRNIAGGR
jgi:bacterioferritin-associated ferredoxin